jgi:GT2 family glycosyltransferase
MWEGRAEGGRGEASEPHSKPGRARDVKSLSFLVLNWNGEEIISHCLDAATKALNPFAGDAEIVVVDNGSTDNSPSLIEREFPEVKLFRLERNLGFSEGNNWGARKCQGDVIILLNNDAIVQPGFLPPLLPHFEDPAVFAVSPKVYGRDGKTFTMGKTEARFALGVIRLTFGEDSLASPEPCLFATAGSGAFDRRKYLDLGGFLNLQYWQDTELCYRAWKKKGWSTRYEPRSLVHHDLATSIRRVVSRKQLKVIRDRDRFLFQWYSISEPSLVLEHLGWLPFALLYFSLKGRMSYAMGFLQALRNWRQFKADADRKVAPGPEVMTDRQILTATGCRAGG